MSRTKNVIAVNSAPPTSPVGRNVRGVEFTGPTHLQLAGCGLPGRWSRPGYTQRRQVIVGFREIRVDIVLGTDADDDQLAALAKHTERYCVVYQTLRVGADVSMLLRRG